MNVSSPDVLFNELYAKGGRPQKMKNLEAIHQLCREQHSKGSKDFSLGAIGRLCEQRGFLKARVLYNGPQSDYKRLIQAWQNFSGPRVTKPNLDEIEADALVSRIDDPAVRICVQQLIAERSKLRGQLNTLKAATTIVIDRRPTGVDASISALNKALILSESERCALERAICPQFIADQGWEEIAIGEIVTARGRTVFDPGFTTSIRKVLAHVKEEFGGTSFGARTSRSFKKR